MPKSRLEAFSDGVFAIVITLLVLEIKIPALPAPVDERALVAALVAELPMLVSCIVSFVIIAIFWVAHHQFFQTVRHADWTLLWLNNLLLLFVVFIPIPTGLVGTYPGLHAPAILYGVVMGLAGAAFAAMRWYSGFVANLVDLPLSHRRRALQRALLSPALNFGGAAVAVWAPQGALAFYVVVPIIYFALPAFMRAPAAAEQKRA
jgi:uncharacterized membrane protein